MNALFNLRTAEIALKKSIERALMFNPFIPKDDYLKLREYGIIPTVDFILIRDDERKRTEFFLIRRRGDSINGALWFLGGKQYRGEPVEKALKRLFEVETGLSFEKDVISTRLAHVQDIFIEACDTPRGRINDAHMQMHIHLVKIKRGVEPSSDGSWSDPKWYKPETVVLETEGILPDLVVALGRTGLLSP